MSKPVDDSRIPLYKQIERLTRELTEAREETVRLLGVLTRIASRTEGFTSFDDFKRWIGEGLDAAAERELREDTVLALGAERDRLLKENEELRGRLNALR